MSEVQSRRTAISIMGSALAVAALPVTNVAVAAGHSDHALIATAKKCAEIRDEMAPLEKRMAELHEQAKALYPKRPRKLSSRDIMTEEMRPIMRYEIRQHCDGMIAFQGERTRGRWEQWASEREALHDEYEAMDRAIDDRVGFTAAWSRVCSLDIEACALEETIAYSAPTTVAGVLAQLGLLKRFIETEDDNPLEDTLVASAINALSRLF